MLKKAATNLRAVLVAALVSLTFTSVWTLDVSNGFSTRPLYGVTYSPFALDLSTMCLPPASVEADMLKISENAERVRIYNIAVCPDNTNVILNFAKANNMKVLVGLFISDDTALNNAEMDALLPLMKNHGDVVDAVVVGNEPVFVEGIDPAQLVKYIEDARETLRSNGFLHPVTTAEVWPIYESDVGPSIAEASDFICMNMQPYWEGWDVICPPDVPYTCLQAGEYVHAKSDGLAKLFGKEVWICESGWPTQGERCCTGDRDNARAGLLAGPSVENATLFANELVGIARQNGRPYFYHSIFDEDWKRIWAPCRECKGLETSLTDPNCNTCEVDYHWGVFGFDRTRKAGFTIS